jgi:uncharacterized protein
MLFDESNKIDGYFGKKSKGIILNFLGGEPLIEIGLIDYITEYFKYKAISLNHTWALNYMISISSNGVRYCKDDVQQYVKNNMENLSISITIDGNKELHDSCRKFPNGRGSYDIAEKSIKKQMEDFSYVLTKLTLSKDNIKYLSSAVRNLYDLGLNGVNSNCIFEEDWTTEHAKSFYDEMIKAADFIIENKVYERFYLSLFDETIGRKYPADNNHNYCGGTGKMLAVDVDGNLYPCIRYTPFCLNNTKFLPIGDVWNGIQYTQDQKDFICDMKCITRTSQSSGDCLDCPIETGCSWCSAYNYDLYGTANKRDTKICIMHKARVLANVYYWNMLYRQLGMSDRYKMNIKKEWALQIIDEEEFNKLMELQS